MSSSPRTVLITGANGFVGSRLCRKFLAEGLRVVAGVRQTSDVTLLNGLQVEYRYGDVNDPESLPAMGSGIDYIIHNAGVVKARRPETFYKVNEEGTRNLLSAIAQHNPDVRRVVYISSLAAAGPSVNGHPVAETDEPQPITVYGKSKLAGERAALEFAPAVNVVAVRPPAVYGPGDKETYTFFQAAHRHLKPAIGDQKRKMQLVHVDDLADGVYLAAVADTIPGGVFYIAESRAYTMGELTRLLMHACDRWGVPVYLPGFAFRAVAACSECLFRIFGGTPALTREKAGELLASWEVSTEKARRELGFVSRIPFAEGARQTYHWYREQGWL